MKMKSQGGFTLLELLLAMGILAFVLASFVVMIAVAAQLMVDNHRDLQRAYTKMAVWEIVRSSPKAFFGDEWPNTDQTSRTVNIITVQGTNILQYSGSVTREWKAVVRQQEPPNEKKTEVDVLGRVNEKDY